MPDHLARRQLPANGHRAKSPSPYVTRRTYPDDTQTELVTGGSQWLARLFVLALALCTVAMLVLVAYEYGYMAGVQDATRMFGG